MLKNYRILSSGVVEQIKKFPILYDESYVRVRYYKYSSALSYLRLGFITSVIGRLPTSILDVGFGSGDFLRVCHNAGIISYGSDISNHPLPKGVLSVRDKVKDPYDVITFFDSLEHMEDISFVKNLKCNYVVISVPSCNHPEDEEWLSSWKHLRPDEHLWHFSPPALTKFMKENGFNLIKQEIIEDDIRIDPKNTPNIISGVYKKENNL